MRYMQALKHFGGICMEKRRQIFRLVVVLCLYGAILTSIYPLVEEWTSSGKTPGIKTEHDGMGGGGFREASSEEFPDTDRTAETWEAEPTSFSRPQTLLYSSYTVQQGDIIGSLAERFGLRQDSLISVNGIRNTRLVQINHILRVPNQDGILYTVKDDDTLDSIAESHNSDVKTIKLTNELFSDNVQPDSTLFIPGARLPLIERQEINGDLFIWPAIGRLTSLYGYRGSPFSGVSQFHNGIDIAAPTGTPVRAAMSGRVSTAGWNDMLGNFVVITHHSNYRTLYAHMSVIRVRTGAYVVTGERIGDVGNTGYSTGAHLHFTVYKDGVTINPRSLLR
ncbi:MAG: M23 family metallopeptidase [Treponema sp.]|nr:M23 family metallopeptidase [Treponema sp.]